MWHAHGSEASCSHRSRYASAFGELYPGSTLADVRLASVNPAATPILATTWFEECQQQAESALTDDQRQKVHANMVRYVLAKARAAALESSDHLKSPQPVDLVRRGMAAARLDNSESLKQAIADLEAINPRLAVVSQLIRLTMLESAL